MSNSLRQLACAAWIAATAWSCSGPDVSAVVDQNTLQPGAPGAMSPASAGSPEGVPSGAGPSAGTPSATPA